MGQCLSSNSSSSVDAQPNERQRLLSPQVGTAQQSSGQHTTTASYGGGQSRSSRSDSQVRSKPARTSANMSETSMARGGLSSMPAGEFRFLGRSYSLPTPSCLVPQVNELFKSISERYDIAVTNREKIDEALTLFKKIVDKDVDASLEDCFTAWKDLLTNPKFTVVKDASGDVKEVRLRADDIPKERRKAQKHIRDLLDACHLFLQQREFLQRHIVDDLEKLRQMTNSLQELGKEAKLSSSERKQLPKIVSSSIQQFSEFSEVIEMFWRQVYSLMQDINSAVSVLDT